MLLAPSLCVHIRYTSGRPGRVQSLPAHLPCARCHRHLLHPFCPERELCAASLPRLSGVDSPSGSNHRRVLRVSAIVPSLLSIPPIPLVQGSASTYSLLSRASRQPHHHQ